MVGNKNVFNEGKNQTEGNKSDKSLTSVFVFIELKPILPPADHSQGLQFLFSLSQENDEYHSLSESRDQLMYS